MATYQVKRRAASDRCSQCGYLRPPDTHWPCPNQRTRVSVPSLLRVEAELVHRAMHTPGRLSGSRLALLFGLALTLACNLYASLAHARGLDACAWDSQGPTVCGPVLNGRAYLPGLALSSDLALFVGESEEPAEFSMCLQHAHGVVCSGVSE